MAEYIEREKIVELSKILKDNFAPLHRMVIDAFIYNIDKNIPTADVVEVVRCKDCKHSYINSFSAQSGVALCKFWSNRAEGNNLVVQQDDYCSYGERKCDNGKQ